LIRRIRKTAIKPNMPSVAEAIWTRKRTLRHGTT
jgi:hypothetical protein